MHGYNVCRYHGAYGGAPIKHGRYSDKLGRFAEAYDAVREDTDALLDLREGIAIIDVAVQRSAERAAQLDTPDFRARALQLYRDAKDSADPEHAAAAGEKLGDLLAKGSTEDSALLALVDMVERMAVRQESAWRIRLSAGQAINAQELAVLMGRMQDIIADEAAPKDAQRILSRIGSEIMGGSTLLQAPPDPGDD